MKNIHTNKPYFHWIFINVNGNNLVWNTFQINNWHLLCSFVIAGMVLFLCKNSQNMCNIVYVSIGKTILHATENMSQNKRIWCHGNSLTLMRTKYEVNYSYTSLEKKQETHFSKYFDRFWHWIFKLISLISKENSIYDFS